MSVYGTLDNLHEKVAIHINDTHPTLAIPELMRVLLDDCGYSWDKSWYIVTNTFAYTNHTVMAEALEKWDVESCPARSLPRIFDIICEINRRYCEELMERPWRRKQGFQNVHYPEQPDPHGYSCCVCASHCVNGVSKLHSEIIKEDVFKTRVQLHSSISSRTLPTVSHTEDGFSSPTRDLQTCSLPSAIGPGFKKDAAELSKFAKYSTATSRCLSSWLRSSWKTSRAFAKYVKQNHRH